MNYINHTNGQDEESNQQTTFTRAEVEEIIKELAKRRELIEKGDFMCKVDLKDAYTVVQIHPESRQYLTFKNEGKIYQYRSLAFGLNVAPRLFSKLMRYAIEPLRYQGIRLVYYLDDICLLSWSKEDLLKTTQTDQTSVTANQEILQMDCSSTGEIYINDPSDRRSTSSYSSSSTRLSKEPTTAQSELGKTVPDISTKSARVSMVDEINNNEERPTNSIHEMSSPMIKTFGFWNKKEQETSINVRELKAVYFALKMHAKGLENCTIEVFTDNMRALKYTTKFGGTASLQLQELAVMIQDICNKYNLKVVYQNIPGIKNTNADRLSRQQLPLYERTIAKKMFQQILQQWGPLQIDAFAAKHSHQLKRYWSLHPDPMAEAQDAFQQQWLKKGMYLNPPWRLIPKSILVSNDFEDEASRQSDYYEDQQEVFPSRLEIINEKRRKSGLINEASIKYIAKSIRKSTEKAYDNGWKHWQEWCFQQDPQINPTAYNSANVLHFLVDNNKFSSNHLNTLRSSIASVFRVLHPEEIPLANQSIIQAFFATKRRSEIKIPSTPQLETWNIDKMTDFLVSTWADSSSLTLYDLQLKTVALLCLATMSRPRSDIGRLQFQYIIFKFEGSNNSIPTGVKIHFREPKENQVKTTRLGLLQDTRICPVSTLYQFISKSNDLRANLPTYHTLFLAHIEKPEQVAYIRPSTMSSWVKSIMERSGIDTTIYKAHSIRSASSTKAVEKGHSIQAVKEHAGWSLNSNTFERFYYKPTN
ncbi:hypothetical protein G6F43_007274 [Rhizopus delemar]|nr:hypothetical protein G6F43_007274 [Rhizopus delemar]